MLGTIILGTVPYGSADREITYIAVGDTGQGVETLNGRKWIKDDVSGNNWAEERISNTWIEKTKSSNIWSEKDEIE